MVSQLCPRGLRSRSQLAVAIISNRWFRDMILSIRGSREDRERGVDQTTGSLFSCLNLEDHVPPVHLLRAICGVVDDVLSGLLGDF